MSTIYPIGYIPPVPAEIDPVRALLILDAAGLSAAYEAWAADPARTFAERAFINRSAVWRRDDPVLIAGAAALGLSEQQIDSLFIAAAKIGR